MLWNRLGASLVVVVDSLFSISPYCPYPLLSFIVSLNLPLLIGLLRGLILLMMVLCSLSCI
jgi:hypothetical protein